MFTGDKVLVFFKMKRVLEMKMMATQQCDVLTDTITDLKMVNFMYAGMCAKLLQLCPSLHNPMDCSPPGSSLHGILRARARA